MLPVSRRNFLLTLGSAALLSPLAWHFWPRRPRRVSETVLAYLNRGTEHKAQLLAVNRHNDSYKVYDLPLANGDYGAHSIEVNPVDPSLVALFGQKSELGVLFSLREQRILAEFRSKPGFLLSGHGLFSRDGQYLLATEYKKNDGSKDFISVRNARTGQVVDTILTGGVRPHQLAYTASTGDEVAISHYGVETSSFEKRELLSDLSYMDLKTRKVARRINCNNLNTEVCHIVADRRRPGDVYISAHSRVEQRDASKRAHPNPLVNSQYFPTPFYFANSRDQELTHLNAEALEEKFILNFSIDLAEKHNTVGVVHVGTSHVTFWDTESKKLRRTFNYPGFTVTALNTSCTGDEFALSASNKEKTKIIFLNAATLEQNSEWQLPIPGGIGHHMALTPYHLG